MMARHYAPRAPLELVTGDAPERIALLCQSGKKVGWLKLGPGKVANLPGLMCVNMPADPVAYAARLYAELHALDDVGATRIIVDMPPDGEAWLAVRDRLRRASS
jgi:L-threonylcarbamoyladenylate synthase